MKIYFVRHGHPDYKHDCLTELGEKQACAMAQRLKDSGIERIFSSTNGRAFQTASYAAKELNLDIVPCDFMREIPWKPISDEPVVSDGNPWGISSSFVRAGISLCDRDWEKKEPFCKTRLVDSVPHTCSNFDKVLAELGYQREGEYYRVTKEEPYKTIAVFSHGGSSSAVLSHMLNIPFPLFVGSFCMGVTSIIILELSNKVGELIYPKLVLFNDMAHTEGLEVENTYGI